MLEKYPTRIVSIVRWQYLMLLVNFAFSIFATIELHTAFLDSNAVSYLLSLIFLWSANNVLNKLTLFVLKAIYYKGNLTEYSQELKLAEEAAFQKAQSIPEVIHEHSQVMIKIVETPAEHFGKFLDTPFYEWIDIAVDEGAIKRFIFTGTINMDSNSDFKIPDDGILFPPGILYQEDKSHQTE